MLNSITDKLKTISQHFEKSFDSLSLYLSRIMSGKKGWGITVAINAFLIASGIFLIVFAPHIGPWLGKKSWDSLIYYHDQFLFLGRVLLYASGIYDLWFYLFKKKISLQKSLLICALTAGVVLSIDSYCRRTFWGDTMALAAYLKFSSLKELLVPGYPNYYLQMAPPGFTFLCKILGVCFGFNKWAMALPSLLFSLGALYCFKNLARKTLTPWGCTAAMWLFALNPGIWIYAGEFKQYSCDIFFTIFILSAATDYAKNEGKYWVKLVFAGLAGLLFSHAMFFVLPSVGVALLMRYFTCRKHNSLFIIGIIWFTAVLAMAYYTKVMMPEGMYTHEHHVKGFAPIPDSWENIKWYWTSLTSLFIAPWAMAWGFTLLFIFPFTGMLIGVIKLQKKQFIIVFSAAVIMLFLYIASFLQQYSLASGVPFPKGRLILFTIPPAILIFCGSLRYKIAMLWVAPVILSLFLHCCTAMIPFGKSEAAVKELMLNYKQGDQICASSNVAKTAVLLYTPEDIAGKVSFFDLDEFNKVLLTAEYVHILLADLPPDELPIPEGYTIKQSKSFAFTSVITLQKVNTPTQKNSDQQ